MENDWFRVHLEVSAFLPKRRTACGRVKCYVLDVRYERLPASDIVERVKTEVIGRGMLTESTVLGLLA
jgi:hypothetical protein